MTGIETGLLVNAGKNFTDRVAGRLEQTVRGKWQKFDWYTAQKRYYVKIEKDYGWTRILGKPEPIKLEGIYTDVYLLLILRKSGFFGLCPPMCGKEPCLSVRFTPSFEAAPQLYCCK